jgi:nucleotide-binding universal stress UspA family protein
MHHGGPLGAGVARRNSLPQLTRFNDRGSSDSQEAFMKFYDCVTAPSPRRVRSAISTLRERRLAASKVPSAHETAKTEFDRSPKIGSRQLYIREKYIYKNILAAIDLNEEASSRQPLLSAVELTRTFGALLHVLTVVRDIDAILQAKASPLGYDTIVAYLQNQLAALIRQVNDSDLNPNILVCHGASIYAEILRVADEAGIDLIVVGSHRPAMKDYLLGTNASRVVRHARCSVLVARN